MTMLATRLSRASRADYNITEENCSDTNISAIIVSMLESRNAVLLPSRRGFEGERLRDGEVAPPVSGGDNISARRDIVLSIRPQYSEKILDGRKTVELRRRFPVSPQKGTVVYIYSTTPVRALVGSAEIKTVAKLPLSDIWRHYGNDASIMRADFDAYFEGLREGVAIEFSNIKAWSRTLALSELRERFGFTPPRSFQYIKPCLRRIL